jgi:hypothetical protein
VAPSRGVSRASGEGGGGGGGGGGSGITVTQGLIAINALLYGLQVLSKDAFTVWGVKVSENLAKLMLDPHAPL